MKNFSTRKLVMIGLLIAMQIIFTRFLSFQTPIVRIGFTFIPLAMCSMLYGPVMGGLAAAIADVIGISLFPTAPFFPGFTLSAFMAGVVYGLFLYRKPKNILNVAAAVLVVNLFINLCMDTVWLSMLMNKGVLGMLPARVFKCVVMVPIQIPLITAVWRYLGSRYESTF